MDRVTETSLDGVEVLDTFDYLGKEDQAKQVRKSILSPIPVQIGQRPFMAELTDHILDSPNREFLVKEIFDCVYENKDEFHYSQSYWSGYHSNLLSNVDDWVDYITLRDPYGSIKAVVADDNFDRVLEKMGMIVDKNSLPWVTEKLVRTIVKKEENPTLKDRLLKVGKVLIGLKPDDSRSFYSSLNELYRNVSFENYPSNIDSNKKDLEVIEKVIKPTDCVLADIGCGTGRIANTVAEKVTDIKVIGVDPSSENLEKAERGNVSGKVEYKIGTMQANNLEKNSVDVITVLGRTMPHLRDFEEIVSAFKNFNRVLKEGGRVVFDVPDPNSGVYFENRKKYLDILKSLKIPILPDYNTVLKHFYRVVDSPDGGKSLYDRYVPDWNGPDISQTGSGSEGTFKDTLGAYTGFKIEELEKTNISGWEDSENIYFVATKISE